MSPCVAFHKVLGNIRRQSVYEIAKKHPFVKQWRETTANDYGECYTHKYCFYCIPFCPGNNYNDRGEPLNGGENNCYIAKARYNLKMRLLKGEDVLLGKTIEDRIRELPVADDHLQHEYMGKGNSETL